MSEACLYMPKPEHSLKGKAERLFRRLSYDLWRRELRKVGIGRCADQKHTIVDAGCGPGFLAGFLENWFPSSDIVGVDADERLLQVAQSRCKRARFLKSDVCRLPIADQSADVVFSLHVIEHLTSPEELLLEARRVLRPGGLLVIATPNSDGIGARLLKEKWQGYRDPTHIALHEASFWRRLIADSGFAISRDGTTGLTGIPWLNTMPLGLIHWAPTFIFGFFPWSLGEAYICTALKLAGDC